jgi:hypothetical protein
VVPGRRAPHAWVSVSGRRRSTLDLFDGRLTLLTGPRSAGWRIAANRVRLPLQVLSIGRELADDGRFTHRFGIADSSAVLVRPDGVIAWRSDTAADQAASLHAALDLALGRATDSLAGTRSMVAWRPPHRRDRPSLHRGTTSSADSSPPARARGDQHPGPPIPSARACRPAPGERRPDYHHLRHPQHQELATRISHRNTGRFTQDPIAERLLTRVATDENLHMVFYRNLVSAALELAPDATMRAITDEVLNFEMPGNVIPAFARKAALMAKAGIYDLRIHHDEVLSPLLRHWGVFDAGNLGPEGEQARDELSKFLAHLDAQARRFEEQRAASAARVRG